jgi:hypothetical protein
MPVTKEFLLDRILKIRKHQLDLANSKALKNEESKTYLGKIMQTLTGNPTRQDVRLVNQIANNATTSLYFMSVASQLTQGSINCKKIFEDPESSDHEKTAAVLGAFASASAIAGMFGPMGVAIGSTFSAVFGIVAMLLQATAPTRQDELTKLEQRLRELNAEEAAHEISAARETFGLKLVALKAFAPGSRTWDQENHNTHGSDHFALAKTNAWLRDKSNQGTEKWEDVFTGYAHATMEAIFLLTTLQQKLADGEQAPILAYMRQYGINMANNFGALREVVARCGDYYHITSVDHGIMHVKNPGQPARQGEGWAGVQFGYPHSLSISPRNGRFWAEYKNDGRPLTTGSTEGPSGLHRLESRPVDHCVDISLWPWAGKATDLLLVCVEKPSRFCKGELELPVLILNEWVETRSRFFTQAEMQKNPALGFAKDWWTPPLGEGVVMARVFQAKPPADSTDTAEQDFVYLVRKQKPLPEANVQGMAYTLDYVPLQQLRRDATETPAPRFAGLPLELSKPGNMPFRISVTRNYVYVYTRRAAWRALHERLLTPPTHEDTKEERRLRLAIWEPVALPQRAVNPDTGYEDRPGYSGWLADGLNDLNAWSDDHVVAVLGIYGEMWVGDFDSARATPWEAFDLMIQIGEAMPEAGKSLIVISGTEEKGRSDKPFKYRLRIRVFDETRKMVVDKDETELLARAELMLLQAQLTDDVMKGETSVSAVRHNINPVVARLVGPVWQWRHMYGGALRMVKLKNTSFTFCERLIEAGLKWQAGQMVPDPVGTADQDA